MSLKTTHLGSSSNSLQKVHVTEITKSFLSLLLTTEKQLLECVLTQVSHSCWNYE
jgi:hypothetical protein